MDTPLTRLKQRWSRPRGYRAVLAISLPMVASMAANTVMMFTDRVFLSRYSVDALAAATPAMITAFTFICFFMGIVSYVNTFVAQYDGSSQPKRVGAAVWQGLHLSLGAGVLLALLAWTGEPLFRLSGHPAAVQKLEVVYFKITLWGAGISLARDALLCFYSGRGKTRTVMVVSLAGAVVNIPLDYALINGAWGLPELGIAGAALATVAGHLLMLLLFAGLVFRPRHNRAYGTLSSWRPEGALFRRILRFGTPSGIQFFLDVFAFAFFLFMVGRLGDVALAATNVAFAVNTLAFMPMIGFSIAVSTLVGQAVGAGRPEHGEDATRSALDLTVVWMAVMAVIFVFFPGPLIDVFEPPGEAAADYAAIRALSVDLLRFVALYTVFDSFNLIYVHALKGAGDTRFVGWTVFTMSVICLMGPVYVAIAILDRGIYAAWSCVTVYVVVLSYIFRWRYRRGVWKTMTVLEPHPPSVLPQPGVPGVEEVP